MRRLEKCERSPLNHRVTMTKPHQRAHPPWPARTTHTSCFPKTMLHQAVTGGVGRCLSQWLYSVFWDCLHHIQLPVIVPEWTNSTCSLPCALPLTPTTFLVSRDQQQLRCSDITFPFVSNFKASGLSLDRLPWELSSTLRPNLPFFYFIVLVKGRCRGPNGSVWLICCQA